MLWLAPGTGELLVSGAFTQTPVPLSTEALCDKHNEHPNGNPDPEVGCSVGFSAWRNRFRALAYQPPSMPILHVALSGPILLGRTPRTSIEYRAGHQRVLVVEFPQDCHECGDGTPATVFSGLDRGGDPTILAARCSLHEKAITLSVQAVRELLSAQGVELHLTLPPA